jgi:Tat protein translocase TatB subunit
MFNVGGPEILVILIVALIVLGPTQLPKAARQVGNVMTELRRISSGFQRELTSALDAAETETTKPISPGGPEEKSPPAT